MPVNRTEQPQPRLAAGASGVAGPKTPVQYTVRTPLPGIASNWDYNLPRAQIVAMLRPKSVINALP